MGDDKTSESDTVIPFLRDGRTSLRKMKVAFGVPHVVPKVQYESTVIVWLQLVFRSSGWVVYESSFLKLIDCSNSDYSQR